MVGADAASGFAGVAHLHGDGGSAIAPSATARAGRRVPGLRGSGCIANLDRGVVNAGRWVAGLMAGQPAAAGYQN